MPVWNHGRAGKDPSQPPLLLSPLLPMAMVFKVVYPDEYIAAKRTGGEGTTVNPQESYESVASTEGPGSARPRHAGQ